MMAATLPGGALGKAAWFGCRGSSQDIMFAVAIVRIATVANSSRRTTIMPRPLLAGDWAVLHGRAFWMRFCSLTWYCTESLGTALSHLVLH